MQLVNFGNGGGGSEQQADNSEGLREWISQRVRYDFQGDYRQIESSRRFERYSDEESLPFL
ncbi:unnamed protein product [Ilex paraguariensis]|uniref:Uncharacterized protein n=1 Tax=Ilex paraguariensis TaxID=185542 RepID=A0ABC8QQ59_9AQUA